MTDLPTKKVILITEDDAAMMRALSDTITAAEFDVLQAKNGQEAITVSMARHPDAVLLDILMPQRNGIEVMEWLRQQEWGKTLPIIILTNLDANNAMIDTILKDQPAYYLLKSNTKLEDIIEKIKDVLTPGT